jgi:hypothetical protein
MCGVEDVAGQELRKGEMTEARNLAEKNQCRMIYSGVNGWE